VESKPVEENGFGDQLNCKNKPQWLREPQKQLDDDDKPTECDNDFPVDAQPPAKDKKFQTS